MLDIRGSWETVASFSDPDFSSGHEMGQQGGNKAHNWQMVVYLALTGQSF